MPVPNLNPTAILRELSSSLRPRDGTQGEPGAKLQRPSCYNANLISLQRMSLTVVVAVANVLTSDVTLDCVFAELTSSHV